MMYQMKKRLFKNQIIIVVGINNSTRLIAVVFQQQMLNGDADGDDGKYSSNKKWIVKIPFMYQHLKSVMQVGWICKTISTNFLFSISAFL